MERTEQGRAVKEAVARWGAGGAHTELHFPVCKSGYRPYQLVQDTATGSLVREKLLACPRHHHQRRASIQVNGWNMRPGWASFDQWEVPTDTGPSPTSSTENIGEL